MQLSRKLLIAFASLNYNDGAMLQQKGSVLLIDCFFYGDRVFVKKIFNRVVPFVALICRVELSQKPIVLTIKQI